MNQGLKCQVLQWAQCYSLWEVAKLVRSPSNSHEDPFGGESSQLPGGPFWIFLPDGELRCTAALHFSEGCALEVSTEDPSSSRHFP